MPSSWLTFLPADNASRSSVQSSRRSPRRGPAAPEHLPDGTLPNRKQDGAAAPAATPSAGNSDSSRPTSTLEKAQETGTCPESTPSPPRRRDAPRKHSDYRNSPVNAKDTSRLMYSKIPIQTCHTAPRLRCCRRPRPSPHPARLPLPDWSPSPYVMQVSYWAVRPDWQALSSRLYSRKNQSKSSPT